MSVEFRASAQVVNATAGTTVTVARPTGTTDGDALIALIAEVGTGSITAPAGWTLIGSQAASTSVTLAAYRRIASSEPASWDWTLGASVRSWGWVGAYTGVDPDAPIEVATPATDTTAGTGFTTGEAAMTRSEGRLVTAVAAVRTADGASTTWTGFDTERADISTGAASGTDIGGSVHDGTGTVVQNAPFNTFTASLSCTAGAMWAISLAPLFVAYDGTDLAVVTVEAAFGAADPHADPDTLTWTNISAQVRPGITIAKGLAPDSTLTTTAPSASIRLTLLDPSGDFVPDNPAGAHYPHVVPDVPIRVTVPYGWAAPTQRAYGWVESWTPSWDETTEQGRCAVVAYGVLSEIQAGLTRQRVRSALYRTLSGLSPSSGVAPADYWPCEDGANASSLASALGHRALSITSGVTPAAAANLVGSAALPTLATGARIVGYAPAVAATGQWCWLAVIRTPDTPVTAEVSILRVTCTGTAPRWDITVAPGSPDTVRIQARNGDNTVLLNDAVDVDESTFYGSWLLLVLGVTQDGANVDYQQYHYTASGGTGNTGTLAGRTIGAPRQVTVAAHTADLDGVAYGHVACYTDPAYDISLDSSLTASYALDAGAGDLPWIRFRDLATRAGYRTAIAAAAGPTPIGMGPVPIGTLAEALDQCGAADHGLIHDGGTDGQIIMVSRSARYNRGTTLALDAGQLIAPFAPTWSTRGRIGDATVARIGGSEARYVDPDAASPRPDSVSLSLHTDVHLQEIAGWRVGATSTVGMRYPGLSFSLRDNPTLLAAWLDCQPGLSRVTVEGMWSSHGTATVDQMIDGWTEHISGERWDVTLHCSPAAPYLVPVLEADDDDSAFRADADSLELDASVDDDDTLLLVTGETVSSDQTDYPVDLELAGERVTARAAGEVLNDNPWFETDTTGWVAVTGSTIAHDPAVGHVDLGSLRITPDEATATTGAQLTTSGSPAAAEGDQVTVATWLLSEDGSSDVRVAIHWYTAGGAFISSTMPAASSATAGEWTHLTHAGTAPATTGSARIYIRLGSTPTGDFWADEAVVVDTVSMTSDPQTLTVARGADGYAAAHAAGTAVQLWRPRGIAL